MEARYTLSAEPHRDMIRINLSGFYGLADVAEFAAAMVPIYAELRCAPHQHVTCCDVSGMKIQTQDVVAAFTKVVTNPRTRSRKLAFVTGSSLARLQTQRAAARDNVAYFKDAADAEAWLFADAASIAA